MSKLPYDHDDLLIFLKVIAKVRPRDRLIYNELDNNLQIKTCGWMQSFWRTWKGESRADSLIVIKSIVDQAIRDVEASKDRDNLLIHLQKSINGLMSMMETYQNDQACVCTLECVIDKIRKTSQNALLGGSKERKQASG